MNKYKKAQLSLEYLVVLAIVLIIALVVVYLFDLFPYINLTANFSASKNFWSKNSYPISVSESYYKNSTSRTYLSLISKEKENISINSVFLDNQKLAFFLYNSSLAEGVGSPLCDSSSCILSNCNCLINLSPYSNITLVSEKYDFNGSISDCQGIVFEKSLAFNFSIQNYSNLFYKPIFKLPILCIN